MSRSFYDSNRGQQAQQRRLLTEVGTAASLQVVMSLNTENYYSDELARLRDELKLISDELSLSKSQVRQTRIQLSECQTEQLSAQLHNTRITREKELLEIRLSSVENLLNVKSIDYLQYISQSSNAQNDLEYTISSLKSDLSIEKKKTATLTDNYSILEEKFDELLLENGGNDAKLIDQQFAMSQEIQDACRMRDLYKRYFEEMGSKFEDLEKRAEEDRVTYEQYVEALQQQQQSLAEEAQALLERQGAEMQAKVSELEQQLQEAASSAESIANPLNRSNLVTTIPDELSDMLMTGRVALQDIDVPGLFNKAVLYEKRYLDERNKCIDLETYVQHLLQNHAVEMGGVAEQVADYGRLSKAYSELGGRLEAVLAQSDQLQSQLAVLAPRASEGELQSALLQQQNKDLSKQLQHLLMRSQGAASTLQRPAHSLSPSANDVISSKLLTFDDIAQLQLRNSQLVQALRALSADEGDRLGEDFGSDAFAQQLLGSAGREKSKQVRELAAELQHTREARQQAEEMIDQLMTQVDTYKQLMGSGKQVSSPQGPSDSSPSKALREARAKAASLEGEMTSLRHENGRLVESEQVTAAAVAALRRECADLRAAAARDGAAARLFQDKHQRFADAHKSLVAEMSETTQRLGDKERECFDIARRLRSSEERAARGADQASVAQEELQQVRCELETTRAAEQQLIGRLVVNQELLQKHVVLVESMQRIEAGMQSREREQLDSLLHEREALLKSCKALRAELDAKELGFVQRSRQLEQELSATRARLDAASGDLSSARERLLREQSTSRSLQARAEVLEKQNGIALERLGVLQGVPLESFERPDLQAKEVELEQAAVHIESLRQQLALTETHLGEFQRISAVAEQQAREREQELASMSTQCAAEQQRAREELQRVQELEVALQSKERELEAEKERLRERVAQLEAEVAEQARGAEALRQSLAEAQGYVDIFKAEMQKFQQTAKAAYLSYEKEAASRQELELRLSNQEAEKAGLREELNKLRSLELDESAAKSAQQGANEQLEGLRRVNDLLHGQVQSLGMQLDRARAQQSGVSIERDNNQGQGEGEGEDADVGESELEGARRSAQELREVIRYVKREKEGVEAKYIAQGSEILHLKGTLAAAQRQLEEVRAELKRERKRSHGGWSRSDQFDRLMVEITQNNLVRETNAKLRQQNEELLGRVGAMEAELGEARAGSLPLQQEVQRLRTERDSLEVGLKEKGAEVMTLHRRLQQLLSRYEAVDPEIHRSLKSSLDEITSAVTAAKAEAATKEAEMAQIRQRHGSLEANQAKLRNKLREVLAQVDELRKEKADVEARRSESEERGDKLARELAASTSRLEVLQGELDGARAQAEEQARQAAEGRRDGEAAARELDACRRELVQLREEAREEPPAPQSEPPAAPAPAPAESTSSSSSAAISNITSKKRKEAAAPEAMTAPPPQADGAAANPLKSMKDRLFELQARKHSVDKEREKDAAGPPETKKTKVQAVPIQAVPVQAAPSPFNPFAAFAKQAPPQGLGIFGGGLSAAAAPFKPTATATATPFLAVGSGPFAAKGPSTQEKAAAPLFGAASAAADEKERAKATRAHRFGIAEPAKDDDEEDDEDQEDEDDARYDDADTWEGDEEDV